MEMQFIFLLLVVPACTTFFLHRVECVNFPSHLFLPLQPFHRLPAGRADQRFSGALMGWQLGS
jgi:hypothetical protein